MGNLIDKVGTDVSIRVEGVWSYDFDVIVSKMYALICDEYRELLAGNVVFVNVRTVAGFIEARFYTYDLSVTVDYVTGDPVDGWDGMFVYSESIDYDCGMRRELLSYFDFENWGSVEIETEDVDVTRAYDVLTITLESNTENVWLKDVTSIDSYIVESPTGENELYVYTDSCGKVTEIEVSFDGGYCDVIGTRKVIV